MKVPASQQQSLDVDAPLDTFSQCHAGILSHMEAMAQLPLLVSAAARARDIAAGTLALFKDAVLNHHAEEEAELFPAVLRSAAAGEERHRVQQMVDRLSSEHRLLESLWKALEPSVTAAARGKPAEMDSGMTDQLVRGYIEHARFEEEDFLPLAATILARNGDHMAALGLSLHLRHVPQPVGYI